MEALKGFLLLLALGIIYFIPTIRAYRVKHRQKDPIFLINLTLGWSIIGWLVALIWSFSAQDTKASAS